jgi:predicted Zn-ribbon and HTH transcriptional regulator
MEDEKRRYLMVVVIVVCLGTAAVVYWQTSGGGRTRNIGYPSKDEKILVKCNNPNCGAVYEIPSKEYYEFVQQAGPMAETSRAMECKKCGEKSVFRAVECEKCGHVFFHGARRGDFSDRCPKCGFSKTESALRNGASGRGRQ